MLADESYYTKFKTKKQLGLYVSYYEYQEKNELEN